MFKRISSSLGLHAVKIALMWMNISPHSPLMILCRLRLANIPPVVVLVSVVTYTIEVSTKVWRELQSASVWRSGPVNRTFSKVRGSTKDVKIDG
jgi:hypothetical protein